MEDYEAKLNALEAERDKARRELKDVTLRFERHIDRGIKVRQEKLARIKQLELDNSKLSAAISSLNARITAMQRVQDAKQSKRKKDKRKQEMRELKRTEQDRRP